MIDYIDPEIWERSSVNHDLIITDGTLVVNGHSYTITGDTVTIKNDVIEQEAFGLHQALCSSSSLQFGSCESAYTNIKIKENVAPLKEKVVRIYIVPDHDASKILQLGEFTIKEDILAADRLNREVKGYDKLYDIVNADVTAWYNSIFPIGGSNTVTLYQFRTSFLNHFGITVEEKTLCNDNMIIKRTISPDVLSGGDVIKAICEINGSFGNITNEGKFRYVVLEPDLDAGLFPSDDLYPSDTLYPQDINHSVHEIDKHHYSSIDFQDWSCKGITGVTIRTDDSNIGVTVGTSENIYTISGNFLVFGYTTNQLTTVATNLLNTIKNCYYRPGTIKAKGNPLFEVGDGLRIHTTYRGVVTYILERDLEGVHALMDTYSARGTEEASQQLNSIASQFKQLNKKTIKIEADVDNFSVELTDLDSRESSHYRQTQSEISSKVSSSTFTSTVQQLNRSISGKVSETGGDGNYFGYELQYDHFKLVSNGNTVFLCNRNGVEITGDLHCNGANNHTVEISDGGIYCDDGSSVGGMTIKGDSIKIGETTELVEGGLWCDSDFLHPIDININGTRYRVLGRIPD